ncbi:MAG: hypothetical protein V9G04_07905 [Nocardioides sp.]|jgi:hypothetical protein
MSSSSAESTPESAGSPTKTAGAFDIRNIIGALLGIYGLLLTLAGMAFDPATDKTGGINANLWTGLGLLVVAAAFLGWARWRPIKVPEDVDSPRNDPTRPAPKVSPPRD